MEKKYPVSVKKIFFSVFFAVCTFSLWAATPLPSTKSNKAYFHSVDKIALAGVEDGSPSSIQAAMHRIHKSSEEYSEKEKVLLFVAASIYEIAWPSCTVSWNVYPLEKETQYEAAVKSVKNAVYDYSTGNTDFLTSILPALVLLKESVIDADKIREECYFSIKKAMEYNSDSTLAFYLLGTYFAQKKNYSDAVTWLSKAYEKDSSCFEIGLAYAEALNKNNQKEMAARIINTFAESNPDNIEVLKQNAYIAFAEGDLSAAEEYVARVIQQAPNDLEFILLRAKIFVEKKDYIHAVSLLDLYAKQNTDNCDYLILRAKVQMDWSKNYNAAAETIEKAMKLYPEDENVLILAARISSQTDSPVAGKYADELADMVLEKNPENQDALIYALNGLIQKKNWKSAYEISTKLMAAENPSSEVILRYVQACINYGKGKEALETASNSYSQNKTDENLVQAYVYAYVNQHSRDSSINLINSLMSASSQKMKSFLYFRRSYLQRSEEKILSDLRSSLIANPRNDEALFRLYEIYYEKKDYRKAQYYLRQVVAIKPNDTELKNLNEKLTALLK